MTLVAGSAIGAVSGAAVVSAGSLIIGVAAAAVVLLAAGVVRHSNRLIAFGYLAVGLAFFITPLAYDLDQYFNAPETFAVTSGTLVILGVSSLVGGVLIGLGMVRLLHPPQAGASQAT